jgi:hypothetical protein
MIRVLETARLGNIFDCTRGPSRRQWANGTHDLDVVVVSWCYRLFAMNGDKDSLDAREIDLTTSVGGSDAALAEKTQLLRDLQSPLVDMNDVDVDDSNVLTRLKDRVDDARDALLESETGSFILDASQKVGNVASAFWALSRKAAWIIGTSALVLVVPLLYEMDKELNISGAAEGAQSTGGAEPATTEASVKTSASATTDVS